MPLKVRRRKDRGTLEIAGTIRLPSGARQRVRARAQSDDWRLAREEALAIEAKILRDAWHGKNHSDRSFAATVNSYLDAEPRSDQTKQLLGRIMLALGNVMLSAIDQEAVDKARKKMLPIDAAPATVLRNLITPLRAVMRHARRRKWCEMPEFEIPQQPSEGRTLFLLPTEAERLIAHAAPHTRPLLLFLLGTGARMSEALELEWRDVDLGGARAILWRTKGRKRRTVELPPRLVIALGQLPHRDGTVFRWETPRRRRVRAYADKGRSGGGQIKTAWAGAIRRAGLDPALSPHDLRHTWASWHWAVHKDPLALKIAGQWSSLKLVERYAHLMPVSQEDEIRRFWHQIDTRAESGEISA